MLFSERCFYDFVWDSTQRVENRMGFVDDCSIYEFFDKPDFVLLATSRA